MALFSNKQVQNPDPNLDGLRERMKTVREDRGLDWDNRYTSAIDRSQLPVKTEQILRGLIGELGRLSEDLGVVFGPELLPDCVENLSKA